jgi:predicted dehydrogenase
MTTYRIGIIGFAHMHINNVAGLFADHPQTEMVACADTLPTVPEMRAAPYTRAWNKQFALDELGVQTAYDDFITMLDEEELDIVIVTTENALHDDVVAACARHGVHVCVEKPMAATYEAALRMARATRAADTELVVNWPLTWSPAARKAKALIDEGVIGRVLEVKWRAGHTGPLGPSAAHAGVSETADAMTGPERGATWWHQAAAGGGAMLDFTCYGAMVSRWYVGEPAQAAMGMKANLASQWGDAEDNAAILVRFPQAMALLEGSWTTLDHGVPTGPIVYGTEGTLVVERREGEQVVRLEQGHGNTTLYDPEPLPEGRANIAEEYVHHLETGDPLHPTLQRERNLEYMAILDAGVRSAATGCMELVPTPAWAIG